MCNYLSKNWIVSCFKCWSWVNCKDGDLGCVYEPIAYQFDGFNWFFESIRTCEVGNEMAKWITMKG